MEISNNWLPLIITVWGTTNPGSGWIKELNELRNKIIDENSSSYTLEHKKLLYIDWKGIFKSFIGFLFMIQLIIILIIVSLIMSNPDDKVLILGYMIFCLVNIFRIIFNIKAFWITDKSFLEKYFAGKNN